MFLLKVLSLCICIGCPNTAHSSFVQERIALEMILTPSLPATGNKFFFRSKK
jgi:hypothetical protein